MTPSSPDGDTPADQPVDDVDLTTPAPTGAVLDRLEILSAAVDRFHERSSAAEQTNRQLHERIEALQHDQVKTLLTPAFERLASLHAQARESADALLPRDAAAAADFDFFVTAIEEVLGLYDIVSVAAAPGDGFDATRHTAVRAKATDKVELDGTIQRVQRQGFGYAGAERVLLPARVVTYRHAPADAGAEAPGRTIDVAAAPAASA